MISVFIKLVLDGDYEKKTWLINKDLHPEEVDKIVNGVLTTIPHESFEII